MRHLELLATALAYAVIVDGQTSVEEKAKLTAILTKHVTKSDVTHADLQGLTQRAFQTAKTVALDKFLPTLAAEFSHGQQASLLLNLYDIILADGVLREGERWLVERFEGTLAIDRATMRAARRMVATKNDTSVFTNPTHPNNEAGYTFSLG